MQDALCSAFLENSVEATEEIPFVEPAAQCQEFSGRRNTTPMFIPAYNMLEHCKQAHDLHNDEARADELMEYGVSAMEKMNAVKLFKTNP